MSQYYQYPSYNGQPQAYQYTQPYYQPQQQYAQQAMAQYAAAVPFPAGYTSPAVQQVQMPAPQPQSQRTQTPYPTRRHTTSNHHHNSNSGSGSKPLKPAIRKVERSKIAAAAISVNRSRTTSGGDARPRLDSLSRTRTNSSVRVEPDHIFLSISAPNDIDVSNIAYKSTIDELNQVISAWCASSWSPGPPRETLTNNHWHAHFSGGPWNMRPQDAVNVQRLICKIFWALGNQGYVYLTTIDTGHAFKPPRLVFVKAPADPGAHFFTMMINGAGDTIEFVDPPAAVSQSLALSLRTAFPHRIKSDNVAEGQNVLYIYLKQGIDALGPDKNLFIAHILKFINDMAFKLDASVPLARRGILGLGSRREVWIFKGSPMWWTAQRQ